MIKLTVSTLLLLGLVGCATKQPAKGITTSQQQAILLTVVEAHNRLAECVYDSPTFEHLKPCVEAKHKTGSNQAIKDANQAAAAASKQANK